MSNYYLGIDTSAYTTSIAVIKESNRIIADYRMILKVKKGKRGLRQQEAVFQHINNIRTLIEKLSNEIDLNKINVVSASIKPRNLNESYMPVFKVSENQGFILSKTLNASYKQFSHQDGHIAAGLIGSDLQIKKEFLALHISGGTTELLRVRDELENFNIDIIGGTKDVSAGQLVDRIGVRLGLKFPCGRELDAASQKKGANKKISYPVSVKDTYLNFSGTETYFNKLIDKNKYDSKIIAYNLFSSIGYSLLDIIKNGIEVYNIKDILIIGGVASNSIIRRILIENIQNKNIGNIYFPESKYCTDSAIGIAYLGKIKRGINSEV
ncbi:endopeptidase [Caldisalinibacter kiritimatiensis]|uniref:N(6)-L-threonylcarbamoyladenine synthase n=1 Tax=Caldisalinibacter kiritimatiensis TaxID=1304284 RepID=R1CYR7_9FIRM|nr:endopeptidase [Caldisalinibacter kiritimatiensis]EOD01729.1 Endopeptidase [Caldisalinibacter kiritimatiensis]